MIYIAPPLNPVLPIKQLWITVKLTPLKKRTPPISGLSSAGSERPVTPERKNSIMEYIKYPGVIDESGIEDFQIIA